MLPISEIQQWAMAEGNRMFIKFSFLNIFYFVSNQTRSWLKKHPPPQIENNGLIFNTHNNTPPPPFPTPYCGQPYVTEEIDRFLWVGTIKARNDLCINVNIPFVFLHLPTE